MKKIYLPVFQQIGAVRHVNVLLLLLLLSAKNNFLIAQTCTPQSPPAITGNTFAPCSPNHIFTLTANATGTNSVGWYNFPYGGNATSTNAIFNTSLVSTSATYYVGQSAGVSSASITLPSQNSSYSPDVRGYYFTAPGSFMITGVRVPTDANSGNYSIAILKFPAAPPAFPTLTNAFNVLYLAQNVAGVNIVPVNIPVFAGDVIGVLGSRNGVTSYGPGPHNATLGPYNLTLHRMGMQYPLATTAPQDIWTEASSIGRIELYTTLGCLSTLTPVTVSVSPGPQLNISGPSHVCANGNATLTASGVTNYTWNGGANTSTLAINPSTTTTYTVSGNLNSSCTATAAITVSVNTQVPTLTVSSSTTQVCLGAAATLSASGALTYTWTNSVVNGVSFAPQSTNTYTVTGENSCGTSSAVATISVAPLPVNIISSTQTVCALNQVTLTSGGGTQYTWSPAGGNAFEAVVSPANNTVYSVTVTNGPCIGSSSVAIHVNPNPTINITGSPTICAGGVATLNVSGALTYTWVQTFLSGTSPTVSPATTTVYAISGTNQHTCTSGSSFLLIVKPLPTINVSASKTLVCTGNPSTLTATGNSSSYSWAHGGSINTSTVNPTVTSIYTVTGNNAECSNTKTVEVAVFSPTFTVTPDTAVCEGGSVLLQANGATSYTWEGQQAGNIIMVNPSSSTTYTIHALVPSANNYVSCVGTQFVDVGIYAKPTITATAARVQICKNEKTVLTAGGGVSYSWSNNQSGPSQTVTPLNEANYTVTGTDAFGCVNTATVIVRVSACPGFIENEENKIDLLIYPNPNTGSFIIEVSENTEMILYNAIGQVIKNLQLQIGKNEVELTEHEGGIYFIGRAKDESSRKFKLIKN